MEAGLALAPLAWKEEKPLSQAALPTKSVFHDVHLDINASWNLTA
jgi:hypothetical protein